MALIGTAVLMALGGTMAAALWTFAVGLGGAPGAAVNEVMVRKSEAGTIHPAGWLLTVLGQTYVSLIFVAFVVLSTRSVVGEHTGPGKWLMWFVAWAVAGAPTLMAARDSGQEAAPTVQHLATNYTVPLSQMAFFLFAFLPVSLTWGWSWVPHL